MAGFRDCINRARIEGVIDDETADDLISRFERLAKDRGNSAAKTELAKQIAAEAAERRRRDLLAVAAQDRLKQNLTSYRTAGGKKDVVAGAYALWENFGYAGYPGVRQISESLKGMAHAQMSDFLHTFMRQNPLDFARKEFAGERGKALIKATYGGRINKPLLDEVGKAGFGDASVNPRAKALYDAWRGPTENLRKLFNEAGGAIGYLDHYLPQSHDPNALIRAGGAKQPREAKANWIKFIDPKLDWDKIKIFSTGETIPEADRNAFLSHIWESVVTDSWNTREPSRTPAGRSGSSDRSDHRVLHFKDFQSWKEYNTEFGSGDLFSAMMGHTHSLAQDTAMMRQFGPNVPAMNEWLKQVITQEAAKTKIGNDSLFRGTHLNADRRVWSAHRTLDGFFEQFKGQNGPQNVLSLMGTTLRNWELSAKLGSAVITHAVSNPAWQAFGRYLSGTPLASQLPQFLGAFRHMSQEEMTRAGLMFEDAMHSLERGARQASAMSKIANWSRWLPDRTTYATGLVPIVQANKTSFFQGMISDAADNIKRSYADVPTRDREMMAGYGIGEREWRVMQLADLYTPAIGSAKWLRFNEILGTGDARPDDVMRVMGGGELPLDPVTNVAKARQAALDVAIKYLSMIYGQMERAVPQSNMRARAWMLGGSKPGTVSGELLRSASMFHGFSVSATMTTLQAISHELAANKLKGAAFAASVALSLTILGMIVLQLKQMLSGKDPLPMDGSREGVNTWASAFLAGGGALIYGELLSSDQTSFGQGPLETLAGPVAGLVINGFQGALDMVKKEAEGTKEKKTFGEKASDAIIGLLRNHMPILSTAWPTRAAYNRLVVDQLQFLTDPRAHQKMRQQEQRVQKDTGQRFWWHPGDTAPERLPQPTQGRTPLF